jgi:CHAD domain-containing protein
LDFRRGSASRETFVPFRLKKTQRVGPAMQRALVRDLEGAAEILAGEQESLQSRVHKVRRRLKRDRSLVRVFNPAAPDLSRKIRRQLRDAGRELARLRESHALAEAAASLGDSLDEQAEAVVLAALPKPPEAAADGGRQGIDAAAKLIAAATERVAELPVRRGRKLFDRGLRVAHDRARKARKKAGRSRGTDDLHEWRKELKVLLHLSQFGGRRLRRGKPMRNWSKRAEQLLGDDHDLAILRNRVVEQGETAAARFVSNVEIGGRRAKLQRRAFKLGRKIERRAAPQLG